MANDHTPVRLLITGGGTGGHLFPAVAAAEALIKRSAESEVLFIGTRRRIDTATLDRYGFASSSIVSYGVKGKSLVEMVKALVVLPISFIQAIVRIRRFKPDVALGVGGYVTGPVMGAAKFLGIPTIIHEQNSIPGLANRKLGLLVDRVCVSMVGSEGYFPREKVVFTGNPVRRKIRELALDMVRQESAQRPFTILVLGGSQGAHMLNKVVVEMFCQLRRPELASIRVIHQTGSTDAEWVRQQYANAEAAAEVRPFFEDIAEVYREADLLVSRAGATTLTELAVLGRPALLVPYPFAADNHQLKNAGHYVKGKGAVLINENELDAAGLADMVIALMSDKDRMLRMSEAMYAMAVPDAAEHIVDVCLEAAHNRTPAQDEAETVSEDDKHVQKK